MADIKRGALVPLESVSAGMSLKSQVNNEEHIVVAVTDERIYMQIGGPTRYKRVKVGFGDNKKLVEEVDGDNSGQLREYGLASYQRKGFSLLGYVEQDVLKEYIYGYLKEVSKLSDEEIEKFGTEAMSEDLGEAPKLSAVTDETPEEDDDELEEDEDDIDDDDEEDEPEEEQ